MFPRRRQLGLPAVAVLVFLAGIWRAIGDHTEPDLVALLLISGGLLVLLHGGDIVRWLSARLTTLKVLGVEVALSQPSTVDSETGEASTATNVPDLIDEVEGRVRSAAKWTGLPGAQSQSRRQLVALLARKGYVGQLDATVLGALFDPPGGLATAEAVRAARSLSNRLRIGILIRCAEVNFERRGYVCDRPLAPRLDVGYHFTVMLSGGLRIHVAVVIAKHESKVPEMRAESLAKVPTSGERWLVPQQSLAASEFEGVEVVPLTQLASKLKALT